jgi:hypothetical protein
MFDIELPVVEPTMALRQAFYRLRSSGKSGIVVRRGSAGDLVLSGDLVRALHQGIDRNMHWCVETISRHRNWQSHEIADYFSTRLEAHAAVFGQTDLSFPPQGRARFAGLGAEPAYEIAGFSVEGARVRTPHRWILSGLNIGAAGCVCKPGGCTFGLTEVVDKQACPMGDGTISCS